MCLYAEGWWAGCGDSARLRSDMAVIELIDHLYGRLLAPLALAYSNSQPPRLCITSAIAEPIYEDQPSPIDFNLAPLLTLATAVTHTSSALGSLCFCIFLLDQRVSAHLHTLTEWHFTIQPFPVYELKNVFSIWIKGHNQSMITFADLRPCPFHVTEGHNPNLSRVLKVIKPRD